MRGPRGLLLIFLLYVLSPLQIPAQADSCGDLGTVKALVGDSGVFVKSRNSNGSFAETYQRGEEADFIGKLTLSFSSDKGIFVKETIEGLPPQGITPKLGTLSFEVLLNTKTVLCLFEATESDLQWFEAEASTIDGLSRVISAVSTIGPAESRLSFGGLRYEGEKIRISIRTSIPGVKEMKFKRLQEEEARKQFCKTQLESLSLLQSKLLQEAKKFPKFKADYDNLLNSPVFTSTCPDKASLDTIKDEQTAITLNALSAAVSKKVVTCQKGITKIRVTGNKAKCPPGYRSVKGTR